MYKRQVFYELDKAKNYTDYVHAVSQLQSPGQNCVFISKRGEIALRTEGNFPAKWPGQGDWPMPGLDSSYMWQGMIPQEEVPQQYNPERGFVSSANQRPVPREYGYYLGNDYPVPRGLRLNKRLAAVDSITVDDMKALQNDNYETFASMALPALLKQVNKETLSSSELNVYNALASWNYDCPTDSEIPAMWKEWWKAFRKNTLSDEFEKSPKNTLQPQESTLLEAILRDTAFRMFDNIHTPQQEGFRSIALASLQEAALKIDSLKAAGKLAWGNYKATRIYHLTKLPELSTDVLQVPGDGWSLNANKMDTVSKQAHGPSWRMIVELSLIHI